ncbi:MAG TPA: SEC-C metal-binding domain-containing protein [Polyangiaceae bacterium]|nr:SEC-C metal-binding domain-containing protein [Polyangiaceae bacterium]
MTQMIDTQLNTTVTSEPRVGRNERCPCGSGTKYKKCCSLLVFRGKPGLIVSPAEWVSPAPSEWQSAYDVTALPSFVYSSLACEVSQGDISVAIAIYRRVDEQEWILEVQNDRDGSRMWEEFFPSEEAALEAGLRAIQQDGIEFYAVNPCDSPGWPYH